MLQPVLHVRFSSVSAASHHSAASKCDDLRGFADGNQPIIRVEQQLRCSECSCQIIEEV
jgi:hypothetical protein